MRVLYLNHTSRVSGAERSLLCLATRVSSRAEVFLAAPEGDLLQRARSEGIATAVIESAPVNFRSSPRAVARASAGLGRAGLRLRALAREIDADVIHAGSGRAGLVAAFAGPGGPRRVVDIRDVFPHRPKARLARFLLRSSADALVFNSDYTRVAFGATWPARGLVSHSPVDVEALLKRPLSARAGNGQSAALGIVGQITPWKGHDDAIRILALIRQSVPDARLRVIGSVVFPTSEAALDNERYARSLTALAGDLGVADAVEFAGPTEDISSAFASLDVLLVPSWEEPFGRVVAEAMAAGVPVVATVRGGPAEQMEDGVTGFLVEPRRPELWVEPICRLLEDQALRTRVIERARAYATESLDASRYVRQIGELYESLTSTRSGRTEPSTLADSC
jgi:glycosyltransferase involved in cell wall biosynthesis